jgi:hypothetical protein
LLCPTDAEYNDKEKLDITKFSNLYSRLKGHKKLDILINEGNNVKAVEK